MPEPVYEGAGSTGGGNTTTYTFSIQLGTNPQRAVLFGEGHAWSPGSASFAIAGESLATSTWGSGSRWYGTKANVTVSGLQTAYCYVATTGQGHVFGGSAWSGVNPSNAFQDHQEDSGTKTTYDTSHSIPNRPAQITSGMMDGSTGDTWNIHGDGTEGGLWDRSDSDGSGNVRAIGRYLHTRTGTTVGWYNSISSHSARCFNICMNGIGAGGSQIIVSMYEMKRFIDDLKANPLKRLNEEWLRKRHWEMKWRALLQEWPWVELEMATALTNRGIQLSTINGMDKHIKLLNWRNNQYKQFGVEPIDIYKSYYKIRR